MYAKWLTNPESVDKEWLPILEQYQKNRPQTQAIPQVVTAAEPAVEKPATGSIPLVARTTTSSS